MTKILSVTDLGPGDGGKGGVVHKLCHLLRPKYVVKVGGAQGSHGVSTSRGQSFNFSSWGCGTFERVPTHLSRGFVSSAQGFVNEAKMLEEVYIRDPFSLLSVDPSVILTSEFHLILSCLRELSLGDNPRGTVGTGIGVAYRDSLLSDDRVIRFRDLSTSCLIDRKLSSIRDWVIGEVDSIFRKDTIKDEDLPLAKKYLELLKNSDFYDHIINVFSFCRNKVIIRRDEDVFGRNSSLSSDSHLVIERSHGVLTDNLFGFTPHTSALRTLPCFVDQMLSDVGYKGGISHIGVSRAYSIRHGAGPLPTDDPNLVSRLLPGSHKNENRYQGQVRVGPLDIPLLRYAIEVSGGSEKFDYLAITWFDQVRENGYWDLSLNYSSKNERFISPQGGIKIFKEGGVGSREHDSYQRLLTNYLKGCKGEVIRLSLDRSMSNSKLFNLCSKDLSSYLGVPIGIVSFGPTEIDKICR